MTRFLASTIGKIIAGLVLVLIIFGTLYYCSGQRARQQAAQGKIDRGQAGAFQNSAADAIQTQGDVARNEAAAAATGRRNEEEIRGAKGSDARVDPDANTAGLRAICRRASHRNDPACRVFVDRPD